MKKEGCRVRLRLDALAPVPGWESDVEEVVAALNKIGPEMLTVGALRASNAAALRRATVANGRDDSIFGYIGAKDRSGFKCRTGFGFQVQAFRRIRELLDDSIPLGLCKEDQAVWKAIALAFHELTTQIPHAVDIAVHNRAERPSLDYPPVRIFWFSGPAWSEGVETHQVDNVTVRIYGLEKSVADSFKYRHKLGLDLALEALKRYRQQSDFDVGKLLYYARVCRVDKVMKPYLEALL